MQMLFYTCLSVFYYLFHCDSWRNKYEIVINIELITGRDKGADFTISRLSAGSGRHTDPSPEAALQRTHMLFAGSSLNHAVDEA